MFRTKRTIVCAFFLFAVPAFVIYRRAQSKKEAGDLIEKLGFAYDPEQNIFYATMDAWQRKYGYCQLYDEAAAPLSMIMDCEPVRFEYDNKKWLIELWKGQYGVNTGAEVGVYTASGADLEIPGLFNGTFYDETDDSNHLQMSFTLYKNDKPLFTREAKHWWLTGFVFGAFSEPEELKMDVCIEFKNKEMQRAFVAELKRIGYTSKQFRTQENSVFIKYTTPHSPQPMTRTALTDAVTQSKNKSMCEAIQKAVEPTQNAQEQWDYLQANDPKLLSKAMKESMGQKQFRDYTAITREAKVDKDHV